MALLGREGNLEFQRRLPVPRLVPSSNLDRTLGHFVLDSDEYWLGDFVRVVGWDGTVPEIKSGYIHRDELNRITLYGTLEAALSKRQSSKVSFASWTQRFLIIATEATSAQMVVLSNQYQAIQGDSTISVSTEQPLSRWPEKASEYKEYGPVYSSWKMQGQLRGWQLSMSSPSIETSGLGDVFSESIKASVSGSGSLDFIVDAYGQSDEYDSSALLRLLTLVNETAECNAEFFVKQQFSEYKNVLHSKDMAFLQGSLFYKSKILLTATSIDVSADGIVTASADFVTTGRVELATRENRLPEAEFQPPSTTGPLYDAWLYKSGASVLGSNLGSATDDDGSIYQLLSRTADRNPAIAKYTDQEYPQWCKYYYNDVDEYYWESMSNKGLLAFDSAGNLWMAVMSYNVNAANNTKVNVVRINKQDGSIVSGFGFTYRSESISGHDLRGFTFDADNNCYFMMRLFVAGGATYTNVIKTTNTGELGWFKYIQNTTSGDYNPNYERIVIRGNRIYLAESSSVDLGTMFSSTPRPRPTIMAIDLQGNHIGLQKTIQAAINITSTSMRYSPGLAGMDIDSNGNLYFACFLRNQYNLLAVAKMSPNLEPIWNYHYSVTGTAIEVGAGIDWLPNIFVDSQDRVFVCLEANGGGCLMELTPNGDPVLSRMYTGPGSYNIISAENFTFRDLSRIRSKTSQVIPLSSIDRGFVRMRKEGMVGTWFSEFNYYQSNKGRITITSAVPNRTGQMPFTTIDMANTTVPILDYAGSFVNSSQILLDGGSTTPPEMHAPIKIGN